MSYNLSAVGGEAFCDTDNYNRPVNEGTAVQQQYIFPVLLNSACILPPIQ